MRRVSFVLAFMTFAIFVNCSIAMSQDQRAMLANYQAQHARIMAMAQRCQAQVNSVTPQQRGYWASQGRVIPLPQCMNYMNQWIVQATFLETQIHRIQTGDTRSLCEINGMPRGCYRDQR